MPSIVMISAPSQAMAKTVQDFTLSPSTWTVQAPHWLVSQPTCVPVSPNPSRRNWTRSVLPSTSPETGLPFTTIETVAIFLPPCISGARGMSGRAPPARVRSAEQPPQHSLLPPGFIILVVIRSRTTRRIRRIASALDRRLEAVEEIIGKFLRETIDQPVAELGELARDIGVHIIGEKRALRDIREPHGCTARRAAGDTALATAIEPVALAIDNIAELDLAREARPHGADLLRDLGRKTGPAFAD